MAETKIFATNGAGKLVSIKIEIQGTTLEEVTDSVQRLGRLPKSVYHTPAKYATRRQLMMTKKLAPKRTGALRDSLIMGEEKFVKKGKSVFDIRPASEEEWNAKEDVRVKKGKSRRYYKTTRERTGVFSSTEHQGAFTDARHSYYVPASMEYGFRLRDSGRYEGQHYMLRATEAMAGVTQQIILDRAGRALDRIWAKKNRE